MLLFKKDHPGCWWGQLRRGRPDGQQSPQTIGGAQCSSGVSDDISDRVLLCCFRKGLQGRLWHVQQHLRPFPVRYWPSVCELPVHWRPQHAGQSLTFQGHHTVVSALHNAVCFSQGLGGGWLHCPRSLTPARSIGSGFPPSRSESCVTSASRCMCLTLGLSSEIEDIDRAYLTG